MGRLQISVCVLVVLIGIVYYAWPDYPDNLEDRTFKCTYGLFLKFATLLGDIADFVGLSGVQVKRGLSEILTWFMSYPDIVKYKTMIDGVEVLILKPKQLMYDKLHPAIVHFHGGGWSLFHPEFYLPETSKVVMETQCILISVHYRRAPEHVFPAALEDCQKVTRFLLKYGEKFGVDKNRIGIYGDSAGGNLAMATALSLSSNLDSPKVKSLTLMYPALQVVDLDLPSYNQHGDGILTKRAMLEYWLDYMFGNKKYYNYFYHNQHISQEIREYFKDLLPDSILYSNEIHPDKSKGDHSYDHKHLLSETEELEIINLAVDPSLAPLMARDRDLKRLPATFILTVGVDVLRDEGVIAAHRLKHVGVTVEHLHVPTEAHACLPFYPLTKNPTVEMIYKKAAAFFKQHTTMHKT